MVAVEKADRSYEIDAMRAFAICAVAIFHYTTMGPGREATQWRFPAGWVGVEVFFLISGYCIAETARRSSSAAEFLARRISRLYPALAFVVILLAIYKSASVKAIIGNLLFAWDFGIPPLDAVFWSLLVEVKFYAIFAVMTFFWKEKVAFRFACIAIGLSAAWCALAVASELPSIALVLKGVLSRFLIAPFVPFFAVGALASARLHNGERSSLALLACSSLMSVVMVAVLSSRLSSPLESTPMSVVVYTTGLTLFLAAVVGMRFPYLSIVNKIGTLSYVIYLVHAELGFALFVLIAQLVPALHGNTLLLLMISIVFVSSWLISIVCEWRFRRSLTNVMLKALGAIGLNRLRYERA